MVLGLAGAFAAVMAPLLGLGTGEDFLPYRWVGASRGDLAVGAGALFIAAGVLTIISVTLRHHTFALHLVQRLDLWSARHRDWQVAYWLSLPAALMVVVHAFVMQGALFSSLDTGSYLNWHPQRTLGYGLFIRLIAMLADDASIIATVQVVLGVLSAIMLAEAAQRLFRYRLASLVLGGLLIIHWSLFESAHYLLSDHLFYSLMSLHVAAVLWAFRAPGRVVLLLSAVLGALAVMVRPAGLVLVVALPMLCLVHPRLWGRLLLWLAAPLFGLLLGQAAVNKDVVGYFGLSRFTGWPMLVNAMLVLKADTPFEEPSLIQALLPVAQARRAAIEAVPGFWARRDTLIGTTNAIIGDASVVIDAYRKHHPDLIRPIQPPPGRAWLSRLNELSPLNRKLSPFGISDYAYHVEFDQFLTRLAKASMVHAPGDTFILFLLKLGPSWEEVFRTFYAPTDIAANYATATQVVTGSQAVSFVAPSLTGDHGVGFILAALNYGARLMLYACLAPWISVGVGLFGLAASGRALLARRSVSPVSGVLAYLFLLVGLYLSGVCLAHVPIGRYNVVMLPEMLLLALAAIPLASQKWRLALSGGGSAPQV